MGGIKSNIVASLFAVLLLCVAVGCSAPDNMDEGKDFVEKEVQTIRFTNAEVAYNGDDIGDATSDGWVVKLYTDMEMDAMGNFVGPGEVMQLLLNVPYESEQTPKIDNLVGEYRSQSNSGDFSPNTFVFGYMSSIELPDGRHERPDATFYASLAEGSTEMDIDLIDDGRVAIVENSDGTLTIKGTLVGKQCRKRNFEWSGKVEPKSYAEPIVPNSLLTTDLQLTHLTKASIQDRGDCFYLGNESYRDFLIFLVEDTISFEWGKPVGSGDVLRLELLVPWDTDVADGVPAGTYPMLTRNADTSFDKSEIIPYHAVSGLPNRFTVPYWSGTWYVNYVDSAWGNSYARIDSGTVTVERGDDGSHRFVCNLKDCSSPSFSVEADVTISNENIIR